MDKDRLECPLEAGALLRHRIVGGDTIRARLGDPVGGISETLPVDPG